MRIPRRLDWPMLCCLLLFTSGMAASDRTAVLVNYQCQAEKSQMKLTLFADGTLRLKETPPGLEERMFLFELTPEELQGFENRLQEVDLREIESLEPHLQRDGETTESCRIELAQGDGPWIRFQYQTQDSLPLGIDNLLFIIRDLTAVIDRRGRSNLPVEYQPKIGDVLERQDGHLFEVVALSKLLEGVELQGVDQPLVIYLKREELREEFVRQVE